MSTLLMKLLQPYMAPAGDEGAGGGGGGEKVDRGDDFVPTEGDDDTKAEDESKAEDDAGDEKKEDDADDAKDEDKSKEEDKAKDEKKDDKPKKDTRVPLARHKELLEKERAQRTKVEQELARYKQGEQIAEVSAEITEAENKLLGFEKEYQKLIADGELDKAAAKMSEIRRLERSIVQKQADMQLQAAEARAVERARYDITLERLESAYPQINEDHDDFDKDKTDEVIDLKLSFQARGYPPAQALQRAVKYVLGEPQTKAQERAVESEARVDKEDVQKKLAEERTKAARAKAGEAAGKQPTSTSKIGMDSAKAGGGALKAEQVMKMNQEDFAKLDEKTLAKLRGDELV